MKKFLLSLAAVMFAATSFAQYITLEHTFTGIANPSSLGIVRMNAYGNQPIVEDFDDCIYAQMENVLYWWDEDYTQHSLAITNEYFVVVACRNIFTTDNRMCFLVCKENTSEQPTEMLLYDELGTLLQTVVVPYGGEPSIVRLFGAYKLYVTPLEKEIWDEATMSFITPAKNSYTTNLYSLPGAGKTATDNEIVQSAPRRNRKYIQDAQVLVEENERTYNMTGARVH